MIMVNLHDHAFAAVALRTGQPAAMTCRTFEAALLSLGRTPVVFTRFPPQIRFLIPMGNDHHRSISLSFFEFRGIVWREPSYCRSVSNHVRTSRRLGT